MRNDFAIAIGWPQNYCKQPGYWFDSLGKLLGMNKNGYYKIGHSAVVLVNTEKNECHYFDFGRYQTPFQKGRVRNMDTDPSLVIKTVPLISSNQKKILNIENILEELQMNCEIHSEGKIISSYTKINFLKAYKTALRLQNMELVEYGLFSKSKYNCAKFVNEVILSGEPSIISILTLKFLVPIIPSTKSNVYALRNRRIKPHMRKGNLFYPYKKNTQNELINVLPAPIKPLNLPSSAKWLGGEGAGCWFKIEKTEDGFWIERWTDLGKLESEGCFSIVGSKIIDLTKPFEFSYPSNSKIVVLEQDDLTIRLELVK